MKIVKPNSQVLKMIDFCRFIYLRGVRDGYTIGKGDENCPIFQSVKELHQQDFINKLKTGATREEVSEACGVVFDLDIHDSCINTILNFASQDYSEVDKDAYEEATKNYVERMEKAYQIAEEKGI